LADDGGPIPHKPPGLIEAVNYASVAATQVPQCRERCRARLADGKYILVCVNESGKITPSELAFPPGYEESYALELMKRILNNKWSVIGVAFCLLDREAGELLSHYRPFERTAQRAASIVGPGRLVRCDQAEIS